jgi:hypothetical protein
MPLHCLRYQSTALQPLSTRDLEGLLCKARAFNSAHQISGMLLYREGKFLQVLEGEENTLRELYAKILHDPRHAEITVLSDEPLAQRSFAAWAMAYRF